MTNPVPGGPRVRPFSHIPSERETVFSHTKLFFFWKFWEINLVGDTRHIVMRTLTTKDFIQVATAQIGYHQDGLVVFPAVSDVATCLSRDRSAIDRFPYFGVRDTLARMTALLVSRLHLHPKSEKHLPSHVEIGVCRFSEYSLQIRIRLHDFGCH